MTGRGLARTRARPRQAAASSMVQSYGRTGIQTGRVPESRRQAGDDLPSRHHPARLVAASHLSEHERTRAAEHTAETKLSQHAVDLVRPLVDVFEKQHAAIGRREGEWRPQRGRQLRDRPAEERATHLPRPNCFETPGASSTPLPFRVNARKDRSSYPAAPLARRRSSIGPCSAVMPHAHVSHDSSDVLS